MVLGGVALLAIAALARKALQPRVTTIDDLEGSTGLIAIGAVSGKGRGRSAMPGNGQPGTTADGLDRICRMLQRNGLGSGIKVLTIVPAGFGRTGSTFAIDLANTLAAEGKNVLLVLANLRQPALQPSVGFTGYKGLAELLEGGASEPVTLLVSVADRLLLLPTGHSEKDPAMLLASPVLGEVIESLRGLGLVAIIDAPPASFASDVLPLAREADATLLIVQGGSPWKDVEQAARTLRHGQAGDPAAVLVGPRRRASLAMAVPRRPGVQTGGGV